ncbi:hypothetical protein [Glaciibacter superstes]|uniref:hypothetical protein n=1 Tax=Glaciibacter superstes TaxID=501023 RepID=UPI0003B564F9|nr:hypothetical protein [Glaciibacter superstes]
MGVDVNLYAMGTVTDAEIEVANRFFEEREIRGTLGRTSWDPDRIDVDMNGARYYGPGYERGPWPEIHTAIIALVAALPGCTVHYGGDSDPDAPEVDEDALAEMWAHWLSPRWDDYHGRRESFTISVAPTPDQQNRSQS